MDIAYITVNILLRSSIQSSLSFFPIFFVREVRLNTYLTYNYFKFINNGVLLDSEDPHCTLKAVPEFKSS